MEKLPVPDALLLSRLQFAWVVALHILLPAFTVGLASYIAVLEGVHLVTVLSTFWILAISIFPMVVPYALDLWDAAATPKSHAFLRVGTLFLLPVIHMYVGFSYWVFRGKVKAGTGYH
jgi:cytochrome bd-type quinol oxidase subunit 2